MSIANPLGIYLDTNGTPLDAGFVYFGQPNLDPVTSPITVYWDAALTIPAAQPIRTLAGYPSRSGARAQVYVGQAYSVLVRNKSSVQVYSAARIDLENIASSITTTPLGGAPVRTVEAELRRVASLRSYGAKADGVTDCWTAAALAIAAGYATLRLDYIPGESNTAYFSTFPASTTLVGLTLDIDPRITLSVPDNAIVGEQNSQGVRVSRPTRFYFRSLNDFYTLNDGADLWFGNGAVRKMPYLDESDADMSLSIVIPAAVLTPQKVAWPGGDSFAADTFSSSTGAAYNFAPGNDASFHLGMAPCKPGDEYVASLSASSTAGVLVALVRHTNGYAGVFCNADYNSTPQFFNKVTGATGTSTPQQPLGVGTHETMSGAGSVWTIRIDSWQSFSVLFNGQAIARANTTGIIHSCGYGGYPSATGQTFTVSDLVRIRGRAYQAGEFSAVRVYGDSKAAWRGDAWPIYLKDALEFGAGIRCWRVTNRAVAGHIAYEQRLVMAGDPVGDSNVVVIDVGTNDIQGQTVLASFIADVTAMIEQAQAAGCKVVLGIPSLWYTRTEAGSRGQASVNYGRGAAYRSALFLLGAQKGCRVVDNTRFDGPVLGNYVNSASAVDLTNAGDPVLYDNIHPTTETNKRRALGYGRAILGFYANKRGNLYLPLHAMAGVTSNNWNAGTGGDTPSATISDDGRVQLSGTVTAGGAAVRTDNTIVYTLPAYLRPPATVRRVAVVQAPADVGNIWLNCNTAGEITIQGGAASTSTWIDLSCITFSVENREVL